MITWALVRENCSLLAAEITFFSNYPDELEGHCQCLHHQLVDQLKPPEAAPPSMVLLEQELPLNELEHSLAGFPPNKEVKTHTNSNV